MGWPVRFRDTQKRADTLRNAQTMFSDVQRGLGIGESVRKPVCVSVNWSVRFSVFLSMCLSVSDSVCKFVSESVCEVCGFVGGFVCELVSCTSSCL